MTRGTDHLSAGSRSVCVSSYALPLLLVCPPFAILSWASAWCPCVPTRHGVRPQFTRAGESVVPAKQGVSFCRSRCNHTEYQAGLASKQAECLGTGMGHTGRVRQLEEQGGVQGQLLENLWSLELAAEHVHVHKRQWGINRPKSSRAE